MHFVAWVLMILWAVPFLSAWLAYVAVDASKGRPLTIPHMIMMIVSSLIEAFSIGYLFFK